MRVFGLLKKGFYQVCNLEVKELSSVVRERLRVLRLWDVLRQSGFNSFEAAEFLGVSRSTLYRWREGFEEDGLKGLEVRCRRPKRV